MMTDKKNEVKITEETIIKMSAKVLWSFIIGIFLLTSAANYQLYRINSSLNNHETRINKVETGYWKTPMIADLAVDLHNTNRVVILSERELRDLVDDIHDRYSN